MSQASTVSSFEICTIANNRTDCITLINGENHDQILSIAAKGAWNGRMTVPWVNNQDELNKKSIRIIFGTASRVFIFQNYSDSKFCWSGGSFDRSSAINGDSINHGRKALLITPSSGQEMLELWGTLL